MLVPTVRGTWTAARRQVTRTLHEAKHPPAPWEILEQIRALWCALSLIARAPKSTPLVMSNFQHRRTSHPASRQVQPELLGREKKKQPPAKKPPSTLNLAPYRSSNGGQLQQFPLLIIRRQQPAAQPRSCLARLRLGSIQSRLVCGGFFQLSSPGFPTRSFTLLGLSLVFSLTHTFT